MKPITVLVFPCGSEVGLELNRSLKDISFITLIGGSSVPDHGQWEFEHYIGSVPYITDTDFVDKLNRIIEVNHIDFIYPTIDAVVLKLAEVRASLQAKVLVSPVETATVCGNKRKTYEILKGEYFLPQVYHSPEEIKEWPVLLKPAVSCGSVGVQIIEDISVLKEELKSRNMEQVVCEYLPGMEYTVDCFTDRHGRLKYCAHRSRRRVRNGMSVNSILEADSPEIKKYCGAY